CSGTACATSCTGDAECGPSFVCKGGSCVMGTPVDGGPPPVDAPPAEDAAPPDAAPPDVKMAVDAPAGAPGAPCASDSECGSGVCAQGVCCATACTGLCQSCAVPGSMGTCSPVPAG